MFKDVSDRRLIQQTVASTSHMTEFLTTLGLERDQVTRRRWRARFRRWGIDTGHWTRSCVRRYTDEALADAVASSFSYAEVLRKLGVRPAGGSHAYLARRIRGAGIDTTHFLRQAHNRGKASPRRLRPEQVLRILPAGSFRVKAPQLRRALVAVGVPELCAECGCGTKWHGKPLRLIVDHKNGDWMDNRQENLRFLCPNCHAQTATWCRILSARPTIEQPARLAERHTRSA